MSERMILNEYLNELKRSEKEVIKVLKQHYEQKMLDRPELREKVVSIISIICYAHTAMEKNKIAYEVWKIYRDEGFDQILALIPDVEEAKKQEMGRITKRLEEIDEIASDHNDFVIRTCELIVELRQALKGANNDNKDLS